ncbi:hypothetical protein STEG23_035544, partial [Scotinomys teguina]
QSICKDYLGSSFQPAETWRGKCHPERALEDFLPSQAEAQRIKESLGHLAWWLLTQTRTLAFQ